MADDTPVATEPNPGQTDMPVQTAQIPTKIEKPVKMTTKVTPTNKAAATTKVAMKTSNGVVNGGVKEAPRLTNGGPHKNGYIEGKTTRQEYEGFVSWEIGGDSEVDDQWLQDSEQDEYEAPDLSLKYEDSEHKAATLSKLNTLRKGAQFCDVVIEVDGREIACHRAVLACSSVYLFELFTMDKQVVCPGHFKLEGFDYDSLNMLVDYAYTSKLEVPEEKVKAVYKTAMMLKMASAAEACSRYLAEHLTPNNCLATRAFANSHSDLDLTQHTDDYIQSNMSKGIAESADLKSLPCIQMNILGVDESDLNEETKKNLCQHVLSWVAQNYQNEPLNDLYKDLKVLYLSSDNILRDLHDADDELFIGSNVVRDYKKKDKHRKKGAQPKKERKEKSSQQAWEKRDGDKWAQKEPQTTADVEWKVISIQEVSEKSCLIVAMLGRTLARMSLNFLPMPLNTSKNTSPQGSPPSTTSPRRSLSNEKQCSLTPIARMSTARCGVGAATLDGKLIALGGYDRGECLSTAECFDMATNTWSPMPNMLTARGRFDASQIGGSLFACGGSDGITELRCAEYFEGGKWTSLPKMKKPRSSAGVATLNEKLYAIGGWSGQSGLNDCEMYDPSSTEKKWVQIARLNIGRSQAGVSGLQGKLVVVGGCDAWHCFNTVEEYDPKTDKWTPLPNMTSCRRGAGVAVFNGKLFVVGGSDGTNALATSEVYDPETSSWSIGPEMSIPRANVGLIVHNKRLFAVGGFSGKEFLDTVEYLNDINSEWCSFLPVDV